MTTPRDDRVAEVRRRLAGAERSLTQRHTGFADVIRHSIDRLRGGLERAHAEPESINNESWADYVADLDRGLDELDKEIGRAGEREAPGLGVGDVLVVHTSALELTGWRLQVSLHNDSFADAAGVRSRLAAAEAELDRYRAARSAGSDVSTEALDRSMDDLRRVAARS